MQWPPKPPKNGLKQQKDIAKNMFLHLYLGYFGDPACIGEETRLLI